MGKCARCGKESFLFKHFKLKDAEICKKCFRALGFDKSYDMITSVYSYEEIKDGLNEYYRKKNELKRPPSLADLSKEDREQIINATLEGLSVRMVGGGCGKDQEWEPEEQEMFDILSAMFVDLGRKPEEIEIVRRSDNYITAKFEEYDLARFHWGPRSKWIQFPMVESSKSKHQIKSPEEIVKFKDLIEFSIQPDEE